MRYSLPKTRKTFGLVPVAILAVSLLGTAGCGGDQLDIPDQPLQGVIDGNTWTYGSANAFRVTTDGQYRARFLSEREPVSDPCALPFPGLTHIKAIFRPAIGSFSIAPIAVSSNQVQVVFEEPSTGKNLDVTSGFMEIFDINAGSAVGFLQAQLDDENSVEGSFQIRFCD